MVELPEDHFAIDGYKAEVLLSEDTLVYLQKINMVVQPDEQMWFLSLVTCKYDPETGEEFDVLDK